MPFRRLEPSDSRRSTGQVDADWIVEATSRFTPADIEYLFQQMAQFAFEEELARKLDCLFTTETILETLPHVQACLTDEIIRVFD